MICPRCGNEWDATKSPCTRCGLIIRVPGQAGSPGRGTTLPPTRNIQQSSCLSIPNTSTDKPLSNNILGTFPTEDIPPQPPTSARGSTMVPPASSFPFAAQVPNTPRPSFNPSIPETPRFPVTPSAMPDFENNPILNRPLPQAQPPFTSPLTSTQIGNPGTDTLASRGVPQRPQASPP